MSFKVRNKRKIKKCIKNFLLVAFIIVLFIIFGNLFKSRKLKNNSSVSNEKIISDEKIVNSILSYNIGDIDKNFIKWVLSNYEIDSLKELDNYLRDNEYSDNIWHDVTGNSLIVLKDLYNNKYDGNSNVTIKKTDKNISIDFIGDVSLADDWYIAPKYDERGKNIYGILGKSVVNELVGADISIANNEFTVSNRGKKMAGKYYTFRASPERLSIYREFGIDLVTLANNHVYDYGEDAFLDMLEAFDKYNIPHIGAGRNITDASRVYYFVLNGYKFAFVNANRSEKNILTPGATDSNSGVLRCYDPTNFINIIKEEDSNSDFVIALIHWGREDSHNLENVQIETSKLYIDAGADLIVGTHAHVLQGIDFYNAKAIIYNLGDFIFNNEDKDTAIFKVNIDDDAKFRYYLIPAHQKNEFTDLLSGNDRNRVLNDIIRYSNYKIDIDYNTGEILKK